MVDLEALEKRNDDRSGTFWSDAKDLIAEVRALRAERDALKADLTEKEWYVAATREHAALVKARDAALARVAELEKAGDAMANRASYMTDDYVLGDMIDAWRALRRPGGKT